jgi:DHA2 family multidrug resistance protein
MYMLSRLNLNVGYWDVFWPQFIQGVSMGFLFVPLTTVTHDPIRNEEMGNATSIFNLMRNIGGSIGIAAVTTMTARAEQRNINVLGANVTSYDNIARQMIQGATSNFISKGADATTAAKQAVGSVFGMLQAQATMLSFNRAFLLLGILFLAVLPFILLMRKPHKRGPIAAH